MKFAKYVSVMNLFSRGRGGLLLEYSTTLEPFKASLALCALIQKTHEKDLIVRGPFNKNHISLFGF